MSRARLVPTAWLAVVVLAACTAQFDATSTPQRSASEGCLGAQTDGTLVAHEGMLKLQDAHDDVLRVVMWPESYVVREDGGRLSLFDGQGHQLAQEGDRVRLGGGEDTTKTWWACEGVELLVNP